MATRQARLKADMATGFNPTEGNDISTLSEVIRGSALVAVLLFVACRRGRSKRSSGLPLTGSSDSGELVVALALFGS